MSDVSNTPAVQRVIRREDWKRFLRGLLAGDSSGTTQALVAALTGASATKVSQWLLAGDSSQMPISEVEVLPDAEFTAITDRLLAKRGRRSVGAAAPQSLEDDFRVMSVIASQSGQVVAHYAAALADGDVSPEEAGKMLPVVEQLERQLSTLRHDLEERMKERTSRPLRAVPGGGR